MPTISNTRVWEGIRVRHLVSSWLVIGLSANMFNVTNIWRWWNIDCINCIWADLWFMPSNPHITELCPLDKAIKCLYMFWKWTTVLNSMSFMQKHEDRGCIPYLHILQKLYHKMFFCDSTWLPCLWQCVAGVLVTVSDKALLFCFKKRSISLNLFSILENGGVWCYLFMLSKRNFLLMIRWFKIS